MPASPLCKKKSDKNALHPFHSICAIRPPSFQQSTHHPSCERDHLSGLATLQKETIIPCSVRTTSKTSPSIHPSVSVSVHPCGENEDRGVDPLSSLVLLGCLQLPIVCALLLMPTFVSCGGAIRVSGWMELGRGGKLTRYQA